MRYARSKPPPGIAVCRVPRDELFVTHAAVSRHVRDLEAWLDTQLFDRPGRGIVLTGLGAAYASRLTVALDELADATRQVLEAVEAPQTQCQRLRRPLQRFGLFPHLVTFTESHPDIDLSIDPNDEQVNFRADATDIANSIWGWKLAGCGCNASGACASVSGLQSRLPEKEGIERTG